MRKARDGHGALGLKAILGGFARPWSPGTRMPALKIRRGLIGVFFRYVLLDAHPVVSPIATAEGRGECYAQAP